MGRNVLGIMMLLVMACATTSFASDASDMQQLGRKLFFDKQLSSPTGQSCAVCHSPAAGWTGPLSDVNRESVVYPGAVPHRFGNRKPPSAAYASTSPVFHFDAGEGLFVGGNFWDGRATGDTLGNPAADQAQGPFLNPVEQNNPDKETVVYKVCSSNTGRLFKTVARDFFSDPDLDICSPAESERAYDLIGVAIAVFEDSEQVNRFSSRFDRYLVVSRAMGRDPLDLAPTQDPTGVLSDLQWKGLQLFAAPNDNTGTPGQGGNCAACHVLDSTITPTALSQAKNKIEPGSELEYVELPPQLTDYTFDNLGVPKNISNPFYSMDQVLINGSPINPQGEAWVDPGLGGFLINSGNAVWAAMADENMGKHKVPTLRNVDQRPYRRFVKAYTHNGYFKTLKGVVHFYNTRDVLPVCADAVPEAVALQLNCWPAAELPENVNMEEMGNLGLSDAEEAAIVAFMETLDDSIDDDDDD